RRERKGRRENVPCAETDPQSAISAPPHHERLRQIVLLPLVIARSVATKQSRAPQDARSFARSVNLQLPKISRRERRERRGAKRLRLVRACLPSNASRKRNSPRHQSPSAPSFSSLRLCVNQSTASTGSANGEVRHRTHTPAHPELVEGWFANPGFDRLSLSGVLDQSSRHCEKRSDEAIQAPQRPGPTPATCARLSAASAGPGRR
ncbi:MAG: hypothetical protein RL268_1778, partial [Pseudomonadota bacterium]